MFAPKVARGQTTSAASSTDKRALRRSMPGARPVGGKAAPDNSLDFHKISILPPDQAIRIQPKLCVGAVNDPLEHEADRVADQVMRMQDPKLSIASAPAQISRKCAACEEEDHQKIQTKPAPARASGASGREATPLVHEVLRSPGQPLDAATRSFFEPRFGRDFSEVRIHTDQQAARSAQSVDALAYTSGRHVAFGAGQFDPSTNAGKALLAHELAHTLHQTRPGHTGDPGEGVVSRRVAGVNCPANQFGAPANPRADLETADQTAIDLSNQMAQGLAADAETVRGGIPDSPSATLLAYENHFGLPIASGSGFLNRLTGVVRPSQEIALSEELAIVARRFAGVARTLTQGLSYNCPGTTPLTLVGCSAGTCPGIGDAFSCPGNSLVALCSTFWTNFNDTARAQIIMHETFHITLGNIGVGSILDATTRGSGRNFNIAGCYEGLVADITGADSGVSCPDVSGA